MKVSELIKKLQQFDGELEVRRNDYYGELKVDRITHEIDELETKFLNVSKTVEYVLIS